MVDPVEKFKEDSQRKPKSKYRGALSSGSTLLNLACTNSALYGYSKGHYYYAVGDSESGKTFLLLTALAEAANSPTFADYDLIFDDAEDGALMDKVEYFGSNLNERIRPPSGTIEDPVYSTTVEEFYDHVEAAAATGRPFIYLLDSMDALDTEDDREQNEKEKKARSKNKDTSGSYGTAKAKINSRRLRTLIPLLRKTKSILFIISQTRDNVGSGAQFNPKTRSGGKALRFYATIEVWMAVKETLKKDVKGKKRDVGIVSLIKVRKNRQRGKHPTIEVPIMYDCGVDDVRSCIEFLVDEGHWKKGQGGVNAAELDFKGGLDKLIHHIEENNLETELKKIVTKLWRDIEEASRTTRKKRYQ